MIYLIHGTDAIKTRAKWHGVINSLRAKRPECEYFVLESGSGAAKFEELLASQGLFNSKYIVGVDAILNDKETAEFLAKNLKELATSEHAFVILDGEIEPKLLAKLEKQVFKAERFDVKEKKDGKFNIFLITDALAERNRQKLWVTYQKALRSGLSEEEIFWKVVWQVKNLLLVKTAKDPAKLGMHPYALQKTLNSAKKFEVIDLQNKLSELTDTYHLARRGAGDLDIALERFIIAV